jgi:hypothetical protein
MSIVARSLLSLLIALFVAQLVRPSTVPLEPPPPDVDAAFGAYVETCGGPAFFATDHVHYALDQSYGWQMRLPSDEPVRWREELILPSAPREWKTLGDVLISPDRTVAITDRVEAPVDGMLEHGWTIAEGDPRGPYRINLYVEGALVRTFSFDVE